MPGARKDTGGGEQRAGVSAVRLEDSVAWVLTTAAAYYGLRSSAGARGGSGFQDGVGRRGQILAGGTHTTSRRMGYGV